jgi:crossover junction endodeoxyribonuclease RuvC
MRVMGIDPGSQFMGLGCVEQQGSRYHCVGHETITVKGKDSTWVERIETIFLAVTRAIEVWRPEVVAVESVFLHKNADSALKLGQSRGAAIAALAVKKIPLFEYSPREVKQAISSSGGADKQQVEKMVRLFLGTSLMAAGEMKRSDAADALAVAICHAQRAGFVGKTRNPLRISSIKEL